MKTQLNSSNNFNKMNSNGWNEYLKSMRWNFFATFTTEYWGFDWDKTNWNVLHLPKYNPTLGGAAYIGNKLTKPGTDYDLLLS